MWSNNEICCFWEDKKIYLFLWSIFLSLFSLITQTSPNGPLTDAHIRTSMANTDSQQCKYVFKLPALSQHQHLDSQWDCEKAGNTQLGFSFPVVMLAIKRKSQHLASPQTKLRSSFHPRKRCHPKGSFRIYISWMVLRVFHSLFDFIDTKKIKSLFFWQANFSSTSSFLLKWHILRLLKSVPKLGRAGLLRTILWSALVYSVCLILLNEVTHC